MKFLQLSPYKLDLKFETPWTGGKVYREQSVEVNISRLFDKTLLVVLGIEVVFTSLDDEFKTTATIIVPYQLQEKQVPDKDSVKICLIHAKEYLQSIYLAIYKNQTQPLEIITSQFTDEDEQEIDESLERFFSDNGQ